MENKNGQEGRRFTCNWVTWRLQKVCTAGAIEFGCIRGTLRSAHLKESGTMISGNYLGRLKGRRWEFDCLICSNKRFNVKSSVLVASNPRCDRY